MFERIKKIVKQKIKSDEKRDYELRKKDAINNVRKAYEQAGNKFDVKEAANDVRMALGDRIPVKIRLGFNPASYKGDIVVFLKDSTHVFVPLRGSLTLCGAAWDNFVWLQLYFAQRNLSEFLENLGKELNVPVEDRCLYIDYLLSGPITPKTYEQERHNYPMYEICMKSNLVFLNMYHSQIVERQNEISWIDYHNYGFSYKYVPYVEIEKAINAIYGRRGDMEKYGTWDEARAIIDKLYDIVKNKSAY